MRTKILSIIASLLILPLALTSCLNSNDNYVASSDDIITAFSLDTIYGKSYKFTIDQYGNAEGSLGLIYNVDSVPYSADTIINKILIKSLITNGFPTSGETALQDTAFILTDSLDLSNTMDKPLTIRIRSYDGQHIKEYQIEVRRHLSVPDSLVWGGTAHEAYTNSFSGEAVGANQETQSVVLENQILTFTSEGATVVVYKGPEVSQWPKITTDLPSNAYLSSIVNFRDTLYTTAADGSVYISTDGESWTTTPSTIKETTDSPKVTSLITTFYSISANAVNPEEFISGTIEDNNNDTIFAIARKAADGSLIWEKGSRVPEKFPKKNICATKSFKTTTGMQRAILAGAVNEANATKTIPWFSTSGLNWSPMESIEKYSIPAMTHPSIIYYGKKCYAFGDGFSTIYTSSDNGKVWEKVKEYFLFPSHLTTGKPLFEGRSTDYSMVIDNNNFIWIIWNKGTNNGEPYSDEVWKGKLNKLSFLIQD